MAPVGSASAAMSVTPCSTVSHFSLVRRSRRFTSEDARRPAATSASACCSLHRLALCTQHARRHTFSLVDGGLGWMVEVAKGLDDDDDYDDTTRTAMSSPLALRMASLFASSSFRISCRARVRCAALTSWEASNAAFAVWAMVSALRDIIEK